jgi:hypothetical protein
MLRTISRNALTGGLTLARLPLDSAFRLAGDRATSAKLAVDRADAVIRTVFAAAFRDEVLADDAARRRQAANERERAVHLRSEAQERTARADERTQERRQQADERRRAAAEEAERKRDQAVKRRRAVKSRASKTAARRRESAEKSAARSEEAIEARAKRERLETLDDKAKALDKRDEALTAADETRRLAEAAAAVKTQRKKRA